MGLSVWIMFAIFFSSSSLFLSLFLSSLSQLSTSSWLGQPVPLHFPVFMSPRSTFSILVCHVAISSLCSNVSGLFVSVDTIVLGFFSTQFWLQPTLDPLPQLDWFLVLILGWFMTASFFFFCLINDYDEPALPVASAFGSNTCFLACLAQTLTFISGVKKTKQKTIGLHRAVSLSKSSIRPYHKPSRMECRQAAVSTSCPLESILILI